MQPSPPELPPSVGSARERLPGASDAVSIAWRTHWRRGILAVGWGYVFVLVVQRLLQWFGVFGRFSSIAEALLPWMLIMAPLILVASWIAKSWQLAAATVVVALSFSLLVWPWWFGPSPAAAEDGGSLSVVSSNVLYNNPDIDVALGQILERNADLVVLSEMTASNAAALDGQPSASQYPYIVDYSGHGGIVLLSKFPLATTGDHDWRSIESAAVTVAAPFGDVRVIASHPPPPVFKSHVLAAELEAIGADVAAVDQPALVVGDLNTSWVHPPFRSMMETGDLYDTMASEGKWWVATWPTDGWRIPFVTLDHVLATDDFAVVDAEAFDVTGTDHKALSVVVTLAEMR